MTPTQVRHAYGFDQINFGGVPGDGSNTTIAIVDAYDDPKIANDLHQFDLKFGLPDPTFTKVNQSGGSTPPAVNKGWSTEIALDVEWAHAIAPGAQILLVEANDASMSNLMTAVDYARRQPGVVAVSMSWGGGEFSGENAYDTYFTTPAGHGGVTFLVSSGDSGAPAGYPAYSPNVVSVGGTTLYVDSQGNSLSESGWSGSGGGIATYESQPAYQKGVVTQSTTRRTSPDVAYDANPATGFPVYDTENNSVSAPWGQWGGTSDAAPQWAGLIAIADQGLALAGKPSLDGATQTLPQLYQLAAADFHDITTGTSTGRPTYSAKSGYDLVTGRGTPYANRVVSDLVGTSTPVPTTPQFTVTVPAKTTAGSPFDVTVSVLDASAKPLPGYVGTVHFTSSDSGAGVVLPADYTFVPGDYGVHTFTSAVTLVTAGNQTITVTDKNNNSIVGQAGTLVTPAAADQLVFGQQPTSATAKGVINPAVTVKVLDQYNNLVTTDNNSDSVTLVLGNNPGNPSPGTLSGTLTQTVSGGVATFNDLSIDIAGNGYTLVASLTTITPAPVPPTVSSASFNVNVVVATPQVIESFEGSRSYYVVGARYPTAYISSVAKHDGSNGLVDYPGNDWIYRNDSAVQVQQGDTVSVWLKFSGSADGRAYFAFGAGPGGTLSLVAAPNTGQLLLQDNTGYAFTDIASVSETWAPNHWYRLEVDWGTSGQIVGKVFDSNGTTLVDSVTATDTAITSGGIGFRATGNYNKYWDTVAVTPGVNAFAAAANAASVPGTRGAAANPTITAQQAAAYWYSVLGTDSLWPAPTTQRNDGRLVDAVFGLAGSGFFRGFL
jgi:hypothetical protein